ncbi:P-loop containing nucleoside triphosphate hydrolase protein [Massariosphaeria phaeospora]|uniref:P-loop containing nucleoside triphosphate hydrolase protein n=1 Tax=Massariosphaeria phaeospora TaxID=100035 RepID=A0A7C8IBL9_9PLEO|nr:P-loop containing nucleoside triphosphate hydrolase protein [Massariosphaeria phaeospora]
MSEQVLPLRVTRSSSPDAVSDVFTPEASPTESQPSAKNFTGGFERHESDIFIAVMGVTGSGKSTLISKCSHLEVPIGHNLQSCTQEVGVYQCHIPGSLANVYLIDTPGFDDTDRSDTEVLREIATWLTDSYVHDIRLDGIVYLHRIDNPRMQGSGRRNLLMFRKLCGDDALKKVVLTTTRWDNVSEQEGSQREQELVTRQEYWGHFVENGSEVFRHHNTQTSAMSLIKRFVASKTSRSGVTLAIQEQMVNHHQALDQTDAGREVQSALLRQQKKFEKILADAHDDMQAALKERDELAQELLREQQEDMNKRIEQINFDREKLKADMEMLQTEKIAEVERKLDKERKANAKLGKLRDKEMQELKKKFRKSQGGGKAKEEELRPPAGWRSSKEFSLSMNSDRYYFLGPNYYTAKLKLGKPDGEFRTKTLPQPPHHLPLSRLAPLQPRPFRLPHDRLARPPRLLLHAHRQSLQVQPAQEHPQGA